MRRMGWGSLIVGVLGAVLCGSALSLSTPGSCNLAGYIPLIHSSSMSSFTLIICSMFLVKKCENSINTIQFNNTKLVIYAKQLRQLSNEKNRFVHKAHGWSMTQKCHHVINKRQIPFSSCCLSRYIHCSHIYTFICTSFVYILFNNLIL